jgi:hypothetical protein
MSDFQFFVRVRECGLRTSPKQKGRRSGRPFTALRRAFNMYQINNVKSGPAQLAAPILGFKNERPAV